MWVMWGAWVITNTIPDKDWKISGCQWECCGWGLSWELWPFQGRFPINWTHYQHANSRQSSSFGSASFFCQWYNPFGWEFYQGSTYCVYPLQEDVIICTTNTTTNDESWKELGLYNCVTTNQCIGWAQFNTHSWLMLESYYELLKRGLEPWNNNKEYSLGARGGVPSWYIASTLQENGQSTQHVPTRYISSTFRILPANFHAISPTQGMVSTFTVSQIMWQQFPYR